MTHPASPLLQHPGAVPADPPDAGVAAHYGDPFREQRALVEAAAYVDRSNRGVLRIGGQDRLSWLHDLTTQALRDLPAGRGAETLVLSPHGHIEHHLVLADDGEATTLDVEPGTAAALLEFLDRMRFLLRVEPADVTEQVALLTVAGTQADGVLAAAGLTVGPTAYDVTRHGDILLRRMPWPVPGAVDLALPRPRLAELVARIEAAGAVPAGMWAFEALRIAAHRPRLGVDTDHRSLPHELGWIDTAVHLDKGCYRGQETVARIHNLGRPPRRLVFLHLDGSAERLPAPGDPVEAGGLRVGAVGSAARHYELGPVALAVIKRSTPVDVPLTAAGIAATAEPVVDPEAGRNAPRPRFARG